MFSFLFDPEAFKTCKNIGADQLISISGDSKQKEKILPTKSGSCTTTAYGGRGYMVRTTQIYPFFDMSSPLTGVYELSWLLWSKALNLVALGLAPESNPQVR